MATSRVKGSKEVVASIRKRAGGVRSALVQAVRKASMSLSAHVKASKLTGQVLRVQTGRLRRSINAQVTEESSGVVGRVGTNVEYARSHEMGFKGSVQVAESLRTIKQAFGRPINPVTATVRAHSRRVNIPERSFLRSALADKKSAILAQIESAMGAAK